MKTAGGFVFIALVVKTSEGREHSIKKKRGEEWNRRKVKSSYYW